MAASATSMLLVLYYVVMQQQEIICASDLCAFSKSSPNVPTLQRSPQLLTSRCMVISITLSSEQSNPIEGHSSKEATYIRGTK